MATLADECVNNVLSALRTHAMVREGEKVLVGVSGGSDSMCLMHVLHEARFPIQAAYFDHQTRNGESAADGVFVREQAALCKAPFHIGTRPVEDEAREAGLGFEEYARKVRYDFLKQAAAAAGCTVIATGHNADDQAETILMRLVRGTTPRGLAGIPPVRDEGGVRIVRPLIGCTREQILAYLDARHVPFRTDRSNADTRYLRNRIRHELLPLLREQFNPRVDEALIRLGGAQRCENDLLIDLAQEAYQQCVDEDGAIVREVFSGVHRALQRRIVLLLAWRHSVDCPFERVDAAARFIAEAPTGQAFDLGGGVLLRNGRDSTEVLRPPDAIDSREIPLNAPGTTAAFGKRFEVVYYEGVPAGDLSAYCSPARQVFDADAMGTALSVRHRRPGDRFVPLGMTGSKKLKEYFVDIGVPATRRDREILLIANGLIAWVVGHGIAASMAITQETRRTIEVRVTDASE